jgi:anti-sigma factor RsiW
MDCEYRQRLNAFHDGELPELEARLMRRHVETCAACASELAEMREVSRAFDAFASRDLSKIGYARAHRAADDAAKAATKSSSAVLHVAGLLTTMAASVLIVASAWLWDAPAPPTPVVDPRMLVVAPRPAPEWERVAMTLDVRSLPEFVADPLDRSMLADVRSVGAADADVAEWMLQNLSR